MQSAAQVVVTLSLVLYERSTSFIWQLGDSIFSIVCLILHAKKPNVSHNGIKGIHRETMDTTSICRDYIPNYSWYYYNYYDGVAIVAQPLVCSTLFFFTTT